MKVAIVAEYYPRAEDPVLGIWVHRQAVAARDLGAEVRVLVLHRPVPPLAAVRALDPSAFARSARQGSRAVLEGVEVEYVRYLSPPRPWSYGSWGLWAAPALALALRRLRREFAFDLVHAHYAVPAGDAVRRVDPRIPLVVSVHGADVYATSAGAAGARAVRTTLAHARLVLANSAGTARRCVERGARATRVVHLGASMPAAPPGLPGPGPPGPGQTEASSAVPGAVDPGPGAGDPGPPTLVTVGHLVARKRHADVIAAMARLGGSHPDLRYVVVGGGPERERLRALARSLRVADRVELRGQLAPEEAVACARAGTLFVLPSVDEAFGVAYVEAMAGGVPALGSRGEDGPEEIAAAGGGMVLVAPGDVGALAGEIDALLRDPGRRGALGREAAATVRRAFTWEQCGRETIAAYEAARIP
ncbi:MAG TPA: glycosyltransferase [Solirubrobacteraceae bacterium]|nr:glycosyltransferase [Solirubrobacteraceae bacterium]